MMFNDALTKAAEIVLQHLADPNRPAVLVRDLFGKFRVVLPEDRADAAGALAAELSSALGVYGYAPTSTFLRASDVGTAVASARVVLARKDGAQVVLVDRLLTGTEWSASLNTEPGGRKRFTLFSMKGGVGRSTTATALAWHLAKKGKRVLVLDLDLESPGAGTTLLGGSLPRFGIVDWFVEDAVGQGGLVLPDMVAESDLGLATDGKLSVVPCFGTDTGFRGASIHPDDQGDYLPKLGRAYLERGPSGHEPWPRRLLRLVGNLEEQEQPDIVLLDSRTGIHDTSAALILAMGADTLMFAVDTRQTWTAYRFLFEHWRFHPDMRNFRERLWVIGSMVPRKDAEKYVEGLRDGAYTLFWETLYDQPPDSTEDTAESATVFNFQLTDESANHYPREVLFDEALVAFDPLSALQEGPLTAAYAKLFDWFDRTFLSEAP
ncbi:MAG: AAA family ATPase [Candidatus Accumulibacter similis]|nr:MAG: AAA family ATPase [Candidatus Accumulibacter similis]